MLKYSMVIESDKDDVMDLLRKYAKCPTLKCFLETVELFYSLSQFENLEIFADNFYLSRSSWNTVNAQDWYRLENIINDPRVDFSKLKGVEIAVCLYLNKVKKGRMLIAQTERGLVNGFLLKDYYERGYISNSLAIQKVSLDFVSLLFEGKHDLQFKVIHREYLRTKDRRLLEMLIVTAFNARKYTVVIQAYKRLKEKDNDKRKVHDFALYYLLASYVLRNKVQIKKILSLNVQQFSENISFNEETNELLMKYLEIVKRMELLSPDDIFPQIVFNELNNISCLIDTIDPKINFFVNYLRKCLDQTRQSIKQMYFKKLMIGFLRKDNFSVNCVDDDYLSCLISYKLYYRVIQNIETIRATSSLSLMALCYLAKAYFNIRFYRCAFLTLETALKRMQKDHKYNLEAISSYDHYFIKAHGYFNQKNDFLDRKKIILTLINCYNQNLYLATGPYSLYKYQGNFEHAFDSLQHQYLYFSNSLNDPMEFSVKKEVLQNFHMDYNFCVCCFSECENSQLMWSHYANSHTGIMIEYEFSGYLPEDVGMSRVTYLSPIARENRTISDYFSQHLFQKNADWSYEHEVRLVTLDRNKIYYKYDESSGSSRNNNFINLKVKTITLGCRFDHKKDVELSRIVKILEKSMKSAIKIQQAVIDPNRPFIFCYKEYSLP